MRLLFGILLLWTTAALPAAAQGPQPAKTVRITLSSGTLEGVDSGGIVSFKGVPYARPPVGELRWRPPQPVQAWRGIRKAASFGPRPMQRYIYHDMVFRSSMSEDCLYLNIWAPSNSRGRGLPVLVYFYGGGFMAGDGSEPRYDGESMARQGIIAITVNYRLGVFGFLALSTLARESPHHTTGNYGLLDQHAALRWVHDNIAAFGGNPAKVTIAGESAGSMSVSAQMASPLSKGLFRAVIGESGAVMGNLTPAPLKTSEMAGERFRRLAGAKDLAQLRALSADSLLALTARKDCPRFRTTVDGYFLPASPEAIFSSGKQMDVPLLAGTNSAEASYHAILGSAEPTPANYTAAVTRLYGDHAGEVLKAFPGQSQAEVLRSATALASDRFIAYATLKWMHLQLATGTRPVYRYVFTQLRPSPEGAGGRQHPAGAPHASEIPYALGNLGLISTYTWRPEDREASRYMQQYFVSFIKTGDPNGRDLPYWPPIESGTRRAMLIDSHPRALPVTDQAQYAIMDQLSRR